MVYKDLAATIGETPIVELARLANGLPGRVVAKLEMRNPCGSIKDRLGVALIEDAERRGALEPGMTIVEATGGNTATFRTFRHFPGTHFPGTPYAIRTFRGHHTQFEDVESWSVVPPGLGTGWAAGLPPMIRWAEFALSLRDVRRWAAG